MEVESLDQEEEEEEQEEWEFERESVPTSPIFSIRELDPDPEEWKRFELDTALGLRGVQVDFEWVIFFLADQNYYLYQFHFWQY